MGSLVLPVKVEPRSGVALKRSLPLSLLGDRLQQYCDSSGLPYGEVLSCITGDTWGPSCRRAQEWLQPFVPAYAGRHICRSRLRMSVQPSWPLVPRPAGFLLLCTVLSVSVVLTLVSTQPA
ncbi:unnamed protein product [Prorocentrum cordatum]|uniref:Uncharacterized protein n=1 Tax=Prorocentrum cordatum TaxID=2364126 RepID=A0ABN9WVG3_9DINO|nr:unnamed protein product [Polarella glacialis]